MSPQQKVRLKRRLRPIVGALLMGLAYYIWLKLTGLGLPCSTKLLTGFDCPGCGLTRMIMAALRFDFKAAFNYNSAAFIISPVILAVGIVESIRYVKDGKGFSKVSEVIAIICGVVLLTYGIVRNF